MEEKIVEDSLLEVSLADSLEVSQESEASSSALEALFAQIPELKTVEHRDENAWREIKSYVLRGQRLKSYQIEALKNHFYDYAVVHSFEKLDFATLFGNDNPVVIEIGFGMGIALRTLPVRIQISTILALKSSCMGFPSCYLLLQMKVLPTSASCAMTPCRF